MPYRHDLLTWRAPYLRRHLEAHDGCVAATARTLGVSTRTLWRWVDEAELRPTEMAARAVLAKSAVLAKTQAKST